MKHLWLVCFVLLMSCGKDNKSGNLQVPGPGVNPVIQNPLTISQTIVGHWVDAEGCRSVDRRGERLGLRVRYEVTFLPAREKRARYNVGKLKHGEVEYINRCVPEGLVQSKRDLEQSFYVVNEETLYTSPYENTNFEYEDIDVLSVNEISFRGKRLIRHNPGPRR